MSVFQSLSQRKLIQWALAYLASAWFVLQLVDILGDRWSWPVAIQRVIDVLLVVGLFVTLVLAWYHGHKGRQRVSGPELLMVAALLVVGGAAIAMVRGDGEAGKSSPPATVVLEATPIDPRSIAVLPFSNMSADPDNEYFSDGITDQIITHLSKLGDLKVISRTSAMRYRETTRSAREIGDELRVAHVLSGSVQRDEANQQVRIIVQLVRTDSDEHLWAENYDRDLSDIFAIQSDVAERVAAALGERLTARDRERLETRPPASLEAHNHYLRGRFFWNKRTEAGLLEARTHFERAIGQDSAYAAAYAGLADVYVLLPGYTSASAAETLPLARATAERALALDSTLAEAHLTLAWARTLSLDWVGIEEVFLRAIELNPGYATTHQWYALYLAARGRFQEAKASMGRAYELDPLSLIIVSEMGISYYLNHEFDQAAQWFRRAIEMDASFVPAWDFLLGAYEQAGEFDRAIDAAAEFVRVRGGSEEEARQLAEDLESARADSGEIGYWRVRAAWVERQRSGRSWMTGDFYLAGLQAAAGDPDTAFRTLDRAIETREVHITYLQVEPGLDRLRDDRRFAAALERIGLSEP